MSHTVVWYARWSLAIVCWFAGLLSSALNVTAETSDVPFIVDDFDHGVTNRLNGYRDVFFSEPSLSTCARVAEVRRGESGRSLRISTERHALGFCGAWVHFFDLHAPQPKYFDSREFNYLSFWVRGERGGEELLIKVADHHWIAQEDAVPIGSVRQFLPVGITTEWREVVVPLTNISVFDRSQFGGITFEFTQPGSATIYIDDISFKSRVDVPVPTSQPSIAATHRSLPRSMWVWSTKELLADREAANELLTFCNRQKIARLWMQLDYALEDSNVGRAKTKCVIRQEEALRRFLKATHAAGIEVHALDGYPEFCLRESHHIPLAVVDAVIEFNRRSAPGERFTGLHFDNEPHLLIGWHVPELREEFLHDFLTLNVECQRRATAGQLQFGVDIPFWWQSPDAKTKRPTGDVLFQGKRQAASYHCLELLDNVGIMNYRDRADGADGMMAHGQDLLRFRKRSGRAQVFMGVETILEPKATVWFTFGLPYAEFAARAKNSARNLARHSRWNELRVFSFDDGQRLHFGVEVPTERDAARDAIIVRSLQELTAAFGASSEPSDKLDFATLQQNVALTMARDGEWNNFHDRTLPMNVGGEIPSFVARHSMLSKITFGDNSDAELQAELQLAEEFFASFSSFSGFAIHCYESLRLRNK